MKHKFDYLLCFNENISDQFESGDRGSLKPETINMIKGETYANTYAIRRSINSGDKGYTDPREKGTWRIDRAPDCHASPGSNPFDSILGTIR